MNTFNIIIQKLNYFVIKLKLFIKKLEINPDTNKLEESY